MGREHVPNLDSSITLFSFIDSPDLSFHALCDQAFAFWKGRREKGEANTRREGMITS